MGPGRGSGASSLVAYCLEITDLDPMPYNLLFERFLNPERISLPDFDIDFCQENRNRVIDYVSKKYGKDYVARGYDLRKASGSGGYSGCGSGIGYELRGGGSGGQVDTGAIGCHFGRGDKR